MSNLEAAERWTPSGGAASNRKRGAGVETRADLGHLYVFLKHSRGPGSLAGHGHHGPVDHEARHTLARLVVECPVVALRQHVSPEICAFEQMLCIRAGRVYEERGWSESGIKASERKSMIAVTYFWDLR